MVKNKLSNINLNFNVIAISVSATLIKEISKNSKPFDKFTPDILKNTGNIKIEHIFNAF
jgi:hypothetical protein